jgi:hypothetical protein
MSRRFSNLGQRLSANPDADVPTGDEDQVLTPDETPTSPTPGEPNPDDNQKESSPMTTETAGDQSADFQAGRAAGLKEANARVAAVFASEHAVGREAAAAKYLATSMDAEQIAMVLGDLPKAATALTEAQAREAAEEAGRREMRDAMDARGNAELGRDQPAKDKPNASKGSDWGDIYASSTPKGVK